MSASSQQITSAGKHLPLLQKRRLALMGWALVLPALFIRLFTTLYPICATFVFSVTNYNKLKGTNAFVGMTNFVRLCSDPKVKQSIEFTLLFTFLSVALHIVLGIMLALLLNSKFSGKRIIRTVALVPWAMPMIVVSIAAKWAFNDAYGIINDLIRHIIPGFHFDWLVGKDSARVAVILVDVWKAVPFFSILVLAGLQAIPEEIYESARIDGANSMRMFFSITIPSIMKILVTMTVFTALWRLTSFELVYAMTSGGPGTATSLLSFRIFTEAFRSLNFGYASAINVMLFCFMAVVGVAGLSLAAKID